jgi:hypothetical protein
MREKAPILLLQQRDFGQKINASFDFAIRNLVPLAKALLFIVGPSAFLSGIAQGLFKSQMLASKGNPMQVLSRLFTVEYLIVLVFGLITYFLSWATVSAFLVLYEENESSQNPSSDYATPGSVWKKMMESLPVTIGAQLLSFLLVILATFVFILPGIYLGICFQLFMIIAIREKRSVTDTLKRSYKLVEGKWWSTFGLILIMSVIANIIALVFQFPALIATILNTFGVVKDLTDSKFVNVLVSIIGIVGSMMVQGLIWLAVGFQYYNLVERKEGSGLREEIDSLGSGDSERPYSEGSF